MKREDMLRAEMDAKAKVNRWEAEFQEKFNEPITDPQVLTYLLNDTFEFSLEFNGSPADFVAAADVLEHQEGLSLASFGLPARRHPDLNPAHVWLSGPGAKTTEERVNINALRKPNGKSTLFVSTLRRCWPDAEPYWKMLRDGMARQGLVDKPQAEWADETVRSQPRSKQSAGQWDTTPNKLTRLREVRRGAKKDGKVTIGRLAACRGIVDPQTVKTHDPELWEKWEDCQY